jgi:hypothetical protein
LLQRLLATVANDIAQGIDLIAEAVVQGPVAAKGDKLTYNARLFLHRGDEVMWDTGVLARAREHVETRLIDGVEVVDHLVILDERQTMAGIEQSLYGMRIAGYREVVVAPHLAYRDKGLPGLIPHQAIIRVLLRVQAIVKAGDIGKPA